MQSVITVEVRPYGELDAVLAGLNAAYQDSDVIFTSGEHEPMLAAIDLVAVSEECWDDRPVEFAKSRFVLKYGQPSDAPFALAAAVANKDLFLPTPMGVENFGAHIHEVSKSIKKLRDNNPVKGEHHKALPDGKIVAEFEASAWRLHYTALERFLPGLAKRLSGRVKRTLARVKDGYHPLETRVPREDSVYGHLIKNSDEMKATLEEYEQELTDLDVAADPTDMNYAQLNVGIPFLGKRNREMKGLRGPTHSDDFNTLDPVLFPHLYGLAQMYEQLSPDEFAKLNTRATVKLSYQGLPGDTTDINFRKTGWKYCANHPDGLFASAEVESVIVVGFRSQGSKGKKRQAYLIDGTNRILESTTYDSDDFEESAIAELRATAIKIGARVRHVFNVGSYFNDALLPIPSYISDTKGPHYKLIFDPSIENFISRLPDREGWEELWMDALTIPNLKPALKARGIGNFKELEKWLKSGENLERPASGDMTNFDGFTTWELVEDIFRRLLSEKAYKHIKKIWFSDFVGVYVNESGEEVYYYVDRSEGRSNPLKDIFDLLCSGNALTSIVGRTVVPRLLLECYCRAFNLNPKLFYGKEAMGEKKASMLGLMMINAGDDHTVFFQLASLLTGKGTKECNKAYEAAVSEQKQYEVVPEDPQMNAGMLLHIDGDGVYFDVSQSSGRMAGNHLNPERPRTAIGISEGTKIYIQNSLGTPEEERTRKLAALIIYDIYGFQDDELLAAAVEEDMNEIYRIAQEGGSPVDLIAAIAGVPVSHVEWRYTHDELVEMGVPVDILSAYRQPIPAELTQNPAQFFNMNTIKDYANV